MWRVLNALDHSTPQIDEIAKRIATCSTILGAALLMVRAPVSMWIDNIPEGRFLDNPRPIEEFCPSWARRVVGYIAA